MVALANELFAEEDFVKYIRLLEKAAERYSIFIVSISTPSGSPFFTDEIAEMLCNALGTKVMLNNKFRQTYAAAVNKGELLYEEISKNPFLEHDFKINDTRIRLRSETYNSLEIYDVCIEINGLNYIFNHSGLNFVVYDEQYDEVVDSSVFWAYNQAKLSSVEHVSVVGTDDFLRFASQHKDVEFIKILSFPKFPSANLSENERFIVDNDISMDKILEQPDSFRTALNEYIPDKEGIIEVLTAPVSYIATDGARRFFDKQGRYVNIVNGHRITEGQPENPKRSIYLVGGCVVFGVGSRDSGTIASLLQTILNQNAGEHRFTVHNYGFYLSNSDHHAEVLAILKSLPLNPGDIVVFGVAFDFLTKYRVDGSPYSKRPHNLGEHFFDYGHRTEKGNAVIAYLIYEFLLGKNFFADSFERRKSIEPVKETLIDENAENAGNYGFSKEELLQLEEYKVALSDYYTQRLESSSPPPPYLW